MSVSNMSPYDIEVTEGNRVENVVEEAENVVGVQQSTVVASASVPDIPLIVGLKTIMRKKRNYPIEIIETFHFKAVEVLLWIDHYRVYSVFDFSIDLAKYVYGVASNTELMWHPNRYSLKLKPGRKSLFVALYYTNTHWCVLEQSDLRKKERQSRRIFKYRE